MKELTTENDDVLMRHAPISLSPHLWERTAELSVGVLYWTMIHFSCTWLSNYFKQNHPLFRNVTPPIQAFFLLCQTIAMMVIRYDKWFGPAVLYPISALTSSYYLFSFQWKRLDAWLLAWCWIVVTHYFQYCHSVTIAVTLLYSGLLTYPIRRTSFVWLVGWIAGLYLLIILWWSHYPLAHITQFPASFGSLNLTIFLFHSWWVAVACLIVCLLIRGWTEIDDEE